MKLDHLSLHLPSSNRKVRMHQIMISCMDIKFDLTTREAHSWRVSGKKVNPARWK
jgi:hypothetical protein